MICSDSSKDNKGLPLLTSIPPDTAVFCNWIHIRGSRAGSRVQSGVVRGVFLPASLYALILKR